MTNLVEKIDLHTTHFFFLYRIQHMYPYQCVVSKKASNTAFELNWHALDLDLDS